MAAWTSSMFLALAAVCITNAERAVENTTLGHDDISAGKSAHDASGNGLSAVGSKKDEHGHIALHVKAGGGFAHASGKSHKRGVASKAHLQVESHQTRTGEQTSNFKYICCLHAIEADGSGNPEVEELAYSQQSAIKKCHLTAIPTSCQTQHDKCTEECKELLKSSLEWHQLRLDAQQQVLDEVQLQARTAKEQAADTKEKMLKDADDEKQAAVRAAEEAYERTLDSAKASHTEASKAKSQAFANVERLKLELKEAEIILEKSNEQWESQDAMLVDAQNSAKSTKDSQLDEAETKLQESTKSAEAFFEQSNQQVEDMIKQASEKLEAIRLKVADAQTQKPAIDAEVKKASCMKDGKPQDCCCSIHEDGGTHTAMRIKGEAFASWDKCEGGKPYTQIDSKKSFASKLWSKFKRVVKSCDWFGECKDCEQFICMNAHGQTGSCP